MTLKPGTSIGPYQITAPLGVGGMGEVYRATDTKLKREVAIKVLPEDVRRDHDRLARFEREAHVLASLNHPNIASIYGLEESDGVPCLILELVEGQTLAETLAGGALPVEGALVVAGQIAAALEAAHEQGIIHRDLKPLNVKVTPEGSVKVLDFGLAKVFESAPSIEDPSASPTMTSGGTLAGVILGTAAYMSPEQARGKRVDRRTDVWAFGCVLYEMLTGEQAFPGDTASDSIAGILAREPDWTRLPPKTPNAVRVLLQRCLEKDPFERQRDMGDARIALAELQAGRTDDVRREGAAQTRGVRGWHWGWLVTGLALGFAVAGFTAWMLLPQTENSELPVRQYRIAAPGLSHNWIQRPLISPDGRRVVYAADDHLWIHDLDELEPRRLEGTAGARAPFWSPDGESLAFGRGAELRRIEVDGGPSRLLCEMPGTGGLYDGDWNESGVIVFARNRQPIYEVSAQGGEPRVRVALDEDRELDFHSVRFLPDGETLLVQPHVVEKGLGIESDALLVLRADGTRVVALSDESWSSILHGAFASGHIVYERRRGQRGVWAVPFSPATLETTGEAFPVVLRGQNASAANDGTLVYVQDDPYEKVQPALIDRTGNVVKLFGEPQTMLPMFSISPDGRRAVFTVGDTRAGKGDLWVYDLERNAASPLTTTPGLESMPHWSPDGNRIAFVSGVEPGEFALVTVDVDDPTRSESLGPGFRPVFSPSGRGLTYSVFVPPNQVDLWYRAAGRESEARELSAAKYQEFDGRVSPDGRFVAYVGQGARSPEVFVRSFPDGEARQQVSTGGGSSPRWGPRGDELFYTSGDDVMVVPVTFGASLELGQPRRLFTREGISWSAPDGWNARWFSNLEVMPDGASFLILHPGPAAEEERAEEIVVLQNWLAASSRR
jgi:Tol biopolymer transport system component